MAQTNKSLQMSLEQNVRTMLLMIDAGEADCAGACAYLAGHDARLILERRGGHPYDRLAREIAKCNSGSR